MDRTGLLVGALLFLLGLGAVGAFVLRDMRNRRMAAALRYRRSGAANKSPVFAEARLGKELERLDEEVQKTVREKEAGSFSLLLYRAGCFSQGQQQSFYRMRVWGPAIGGTVGVLISAITVGFGSVVGLMLPLIMALAGSRYPQWRLESMCKERNEEILFFLPIVIEQMVIGVSSSLDIGPCIQKILEMAGERDKANPVIELLDQALLRVRSGNGLDESLTEVGTLMGIPELKHALNAIAQVSRHGGEVSRQLQELADAVTVQREVEVESAIKKLELKATFPVALSFISFILTLFTGIVCSMASQTY